MSSVDLPQPDLPQLPPRAQDSHKGSFGNALLLGGSRGMAGAIALAGLAAGQAGAGLVRLAVPDCCLETVANFSPCAMTIPLQDDASGRTAATIEELLPWLAKSTCIAMGPGLGQSHELQTLLGLTLRHASCPVVLDADALNNLAALADWPKLSATQLVITPHPGEWSRLSGVAADNRSEQVSAAIDFAKQNKLIVVLKGQRTLVTDGNTAVFNSTGTPAMATGGSGDVLTGIITALICQGLAPRDAAHLGVFVHGAAAQIAERELRAHVVLPTQLINFLPQGFQQAADNSRKSSPHSA